MARDLPDALTLRTIKYSEKADERARRAVAEGLLAAGRVAEALDLYLILGDEEALAQCRRRAIEEGRPVLLLMLRRAGREVAAAEWSRAGAAAAQEGRWREAFRCYTEAGDEDGLARVREHLPDYEIYTPQGK